MYSDKILKISLISFGFFPLLPEKLKGIPVILLLLASVYCIITSGFKKFNLYPFLILSSLFTINMLSLLNTFNFPNRKVETMLSLLLVPLAFFLINRKVSHNTLKDFIVAFISSSTILSIIHLVYYTQTGLFSEEVLRVNSFRKAVVDIPILNDHPIYISLFLAVSVLLLPSIFNKVNLKIKAFFILGIIFCVADLFLISSKGVIVSLFLSFTGYVLIILKGSKKRFKLIVALGFITTFFIAIFYLPTLERRFRELHRKTTYTKIQPHNSSSIRIGIYQCVLKTIAKKPLFGYGLGSDALRECYLEESDHLYQMNYNAHNQFLGYFLNTGIFGFLTLIGFLFYCFKVALKKNASISIIILLFFSIVMFTENILERQSGIILFIFMVCLFYFLDKNGRKLRTHTFSNNTYLHKEDLTRLTFVNISLNNHSAKEL